MFCGDAENGGAWDGAENGAAGCPMEDDTPAGGLPKLGRTCRG